jgi:hypothetical protein
MELEAAVFRRDLTRFLSKKNWEEDSKVVRKNCREYSRVEDRKYEVSRELAACREAQKCYGVDEETERSVDESGRIYFLVQRVLDQQI